MIFGSVSSYSVQLPVGPDYDNHSMEIFVRIADVYGAAVDFRIGTVQVKDLINVYSVRIYWELRIPNVDVKLNSTQSEPFIL